MVRSILFATATVLVAVGMTVPCQVPVFRYALERWQPDRHEVLILSDGDLNEEATRLLEQLEPDPVSGSPVANLKVQIVDGSTDDSRQLLANWKSANPDSKLPQIVVRSPDIKQGRPVIWSRDLAQASLDQLVDSDVRQQLAEELIDGTSAVWVLLKAGDTAADKQAEETLRKRLAHNEATMKLSMPDAEDIAEGFDPDKLKLKFDVITVNRSDAEESFLVQSLLNVESDLRDDEYAKQPMAFPVFGRGRALYALIGEGIANDTIDEACQFLIGPCSCQVKDQNPGVDLLLAVDWNALVETSINTDVELPPLTGLSSFGKPTQEPATEETEAAEQGVIVERNDTTEATESLETGTRAMQNSESAAKLESTPDVAAWSILALVAVIGILGIGVLSALIARQN